MGVQALLNLMRVSIKLKLVKLISAVFILQALGAIPVANSAGALVTGVTATRNETSGIMTVNWTAPTNMTGVTGFKVVVDASGSDKRVAVVINSTSATTTKICFPFTGNTTAYVATTTSADPDPTFVSTATTVWAKSAELRGLGRIAAATSCATSSSAFTYTVNFNPGTGTGTMASITGTAYAIVLPPNTFTNGLNTFTGWATSATGSVVYQDEQSINLSQTITLTLYAKWTGEASVSTKSATSVTASVGTGNGSAILNGKVDAGTPDAGRIYFCTQFGGTSPGTNFTLPCSDTATATAGTGGDYTLSLTGLNSGKYYFEFVAEFSGVSLSGGVLNFTILTGGVTDTTTAASSINRTSATLNGELSGLTSSDVKNSYFIISEDDPTPNSLNPNLNDTITATSTLTGSPFTFTADATGLTASTKYYFELVIVDNSDAEYYGGVLNFTTSSTPPPAPAPAPVYIPNPPTITSISVPEMCAAVGGLITVNGTYLNGATAKVDGVAVQITDSSYSKLVIVLPAAPEGTKTIVVTNVDGSASTTVRYKFVDTPVYVNFIYPATYKDMEFSYTFTATDTEKYSILGTMPTGLSLNALTGEISGTPTQIGDFIFTIVASNLCDTATLRVYMFVDKAIPATYTCTVQFNVPRSDNITDLKVTQLKTCLGRINTLSPETIDPIIFISGGLPAGLSVFDSLTHPRYLRIFEIIKEIGLDVQIYLGAFDGTPELVQLNVYWPMP